MDLSINHKVATVAVDTTAIITKKDGAVDLLFLQFTNEGEHSKADVVAGVRLNSIAQLEDFKTTIEESILKHKNAEI